jgi:hypothetical protein
MLFSILYRGADTLLFLVVKYCHGIVIDLVN